MTGELKVLRIVDPQGEPDIVECDGRAYVRRDAFEPRWFEGGYLCSRCYGDVGPRDAFCRTCGASREAGEGFAATPPLPCQRPANGRAVAPSREGSGNGSPPAKAPAAVRARGR